MTTITYCIEYSLEAAQKMVAELQNGNRGHKVWFNEYDRES